MCQLLSSVITLQPVSKVIHTNILESGNVYIQNCQKPTIFVFTQWTERQPFPDSIKSYLGKVIGKEVGRIPDPYGQGEDMEAAAHLYDLSEKK